MQRRDLMRNLLNLLSAGGVALTLGGFATAAGKDPNGQQPQARQPADMPMDGATASRRDKEYLAAMKKRDPQTGSDKTKCVDAARRKYGQM
jgi:hypothetical protein